MDVVYIVETVLLIRRKMKIGIGARRFALGGEWPHGLPMCKER